MHLDRWRLDHNHKSFTRKLDPTSKAQASRRLLKQVLKKRSVPESLLKRLGDQNF